MRSQVRGRIGLTLIFILAIVAHVKLTYASKWDNEYWQYLNWKNWENGPYKLYTIGELRLNRQDSKLYYYRLVENFAYQALPYLDLEAHYSFISSKPRGATHFINEQRLELEVNPKLCFGSGVTLKLRNRLEVIKKQNINPIQFLSRHRLTASFPIQNRGKWISFNCSDEVFYDFNTHQFTENRLVPLELTFELSSRTSINVFLMVRNFFSYSAWYRSIVVGSELGF